MTDPLAVGGGVDGDHSGTLNRDSGKSKKVKKSKKGPTSINDYSSLDESSLAL